MASSSNSSGNSSDLSMTKLIGGMAVFVLLGFPLVGYLWKTINDLLALEVDTTRLLLSIPVLALLGGLVWLLARAVNRWQGPADG